MGSLQVGNQPEHRLRAGCGGELVAAGGLRPLDEFDVARDQLDFVNGQFIPYGLPNGYVCDFLFCPPGTRPSPGSLARNERLPHPSRSVTPAVTD